MLIAVNISPKSAITPGFIRVVSTVEPERVIVELTEHARIDDYEELNAALFGLRERGVRLAVDDAGAGFASFRHIIRLGPDIIKLDVSLTRDVDVDPMRRALASSLIRFADEIGAEIIAEGVESRAEVDALRDLGVRYAQGYFFARPGPLLVPAPSSSRVARLRAIRASRIIPRASRTAVSARRKPVHARNQSR
jgi:EAL domain-containing protein (putative c-di-GMP-specific phosphodiesterase class I)